MTRQSVDPLPSPARIVIVSFLSIFIIFGIRLSFSVFFAEFVLVEGWSNEASAAIFSLNMLVFAATAPLAGIALDRWGPRPVFALGVCLMTAGLWLSSRATSLSDLMLSYGVIEGIGLGITGLGPVASVVAGWTTPARRGRALGIAFAGTGMGSLLFVPLANLLIDSIGWRDAYLALSLVCLLVLLPLMVFGLRKPPWALSQQIQSRAAPLNWRALLRNPVFWALMIAAVMTMGPVRSLTVHQIAYLESVGVERAAAANVVGLAGLLTSGFFIGLGWVSDRYGRATAYIIGAAGLIGAVGMLIVLRAVDTPLALMLYALLFAMGEGARSSQTTALASDVFQRQGLGLINGLVGGLGGLGAALGPWLVGRLRDESGSYDGGLLLVVTMVALSVIAYSFVARYRN
ncbi:MAG: MFS transporter [Chloroflexota bacterium]|nr:MFS transporter [Chloroflexota bacterium]MDE2910520.1 MFS transporter [Chloroflexota bacterium]